MPKKEPLELKFRNKSLDRVRGFSNGQTAMAICRGTKSGHVSILKDFRTCREEIAKPLWIWYNNGSINRTVGDGIAVVVRLSSAVAIPIYNSSGTVTYRKVDTSALNKQIKNISTIGRKLLNFIEKDLGWPLTKSELAEFSESAATTTRDSYIVRHSHESYVHKLAVFFSCDKWRMSPQLFSLYTLLLRAGKNDKFSEIKSLEDMLGKFEQPSYRAHCHDGSYYHYAKQWLKVLRNTDKLFDESTYKNNWLVKEFTAGDQYLLERYSGGHYPIAEGMQNLIVGNSNNRAVVKAFQKIKCAENKKEKSVDAARAKK